MLVGSVVKSILEQDVFIKRIVFGRGLLLRV